MYIWHLLVPSTDRSAPRPSPFGLFTQVFLLLSFVAHALAIDAGQLKLEIYDPLAQKGKYVYNSIAQFEDDIFATWSDEQIVRIAERAYLDMVAANNADQRKYPRLKLPGVVSVIVKGHSAYISSSMTGGASLLYIPNNKASNDRLKYTPGVVNQAADAGILEWALMACEVRALNAAGHRTGANCGEPMAGMMYVQTNPTATLDGTKVVTWGKHKVEGQSGWVTGVMNPCGLNGDGLANADVWGCARLTAQLNMIVIPANTASVDTVLSYTPTITHPCFN